MIRTRRDHALALAAMGFLIFPLPACSKEPFPKSAMEGKGWKDYMTSDAGAINEWFDTLKDMNYGVSAGDKFLVVDLDDKAGKSGSENFIALNMDQAADDWCLDTYTVRTPSKGLHKYLRAPFAISNSVGKVAMGVDVRGQNGYVVGPGCYTEEVVGEHGKIKQYQGEYIVEAECEMQTAPQWLLDKCNRHFEVKPDEQPLIELDLPHNIERAQEFLSTRAPAVEGSGGDAWTYQTCAKVKDCGVSSTKAFELMMAPGGWNSRCSPPWNAADLHKKITNAYGYGQNAPGNKSDLFDTPGAFSDEEYLIGLQREKDAKRHALEEHLFTPNRIMSSEVFREMVIPEWLIATGFTALLAERGTGKTVQMMDMACRIACDMAWYDLPVMEGFAAIYICGEDDVGARDMFRAWTLQNKTSPEEDRFFFLDTTCDLLSRESVELWAHFLVDKLAGRRAVVFLDTWQRATSAGSQSDDVEMQTAVHHVDALARSVRGPIVVAAHPPKNGVITVLGSSVIENSTSGIWHLLDENGERKLTVERIKGKGRGNYQKFEYKEVMLNKQDDFGREITGIVPYRIGGTTTKGSAQEIERADFYRNSYAIVLHELMQRANDEPNTAYKFSLNDMASRIMALAHDDMQYGMLPEKPSSQRAVANRLDELFGRGSGTYMLDPESGVCLILESAPKGKRFRYMQTEGLKQ